MTVRRWWPPLVWAALLLVGTSLPQAYLPPLGGRDRSIHFLSYMVLGILAARAAGIQRRPRPLLAVIAGVAAFGAFDEWHQTWIPGRDADPGDWAADALGGTLGALVSWAQRPDPRPA